MARRYSNKMSVDRVGKRAEKSNYRLMIPNNGLEGSPVQEDWNEPALLPRGVKEVDMQFMPNRHKSGRLGDLYKQVEKNMREDQEGFDSLTDPTNW